MNSISAALGISQLRRLKKKLLKEREYTRDICLILKIQKYQDTAL